MKLYDCFMFYDETMLLKIRLNILHKFVDKFIITEARYLHNGKEKKLNFDINEFKEFSKKIEYVIVDDQPSTIISDERNQNEARSKEILIINSLKRENHQREMLMRGLENLDGEDVIMISDVDEIPNLNNFNFNEIGNHIVVFKQKMFYFKFNLFYENFDWYGSKAVKKKNFISPQWLRNIKNKNYPFWRLDTCFSKKKYRNIKFVENGGWHFTCIKKPKEVHQKLLSYLHHQDYENSGISLNELEKRISNKEVLYDHNLDKKNSNKWLSKKKLKKIDLINLPKYLIDNQNNFKEWIEK